MKKLLFGLALGALALAVVATKKNEKMSDALKFKKAYESDNGKKRGKDGKVIRSLDIPSNNPIVYSDCSNILEKMNNNESFVVYFGFSECPWCRSCIETMIETAKENNVDKVYYVDVKDVRDSLVIADDGSVMMVKEPGKGYDELVERLSSVLDDYVLQNIDGNEVNTGEKRIYAPNFVIVKDGQPLIKIDGTSSLQKDPYEELSVEMIDDMQDIFKNAFDLLHDKSACGIKGC